MLKLKAIRGSLLTGGVSFLLRPLNLFVSVLLLRLLDPEDFGLIALAMLLLTSSSLFSGLGMGAAIVHTDLDQQKAAFHALIVTVVTGSLLYSIVVLNAAFFANLLGNAEVMIIIRWLSIIILLDALAIVPEGLLSKELLFERLSAVTFVTEIVNIVLSLLLAMTGFGLWSLVYARMGSALARTALTWLLCPGWGWLQPRRWDWQLVKALLHYGVNNTASGFVSYFHTYWDDWLVGRWLGATQLGFYNRAYELSNKTLASISGVMINSVFFPLYVRMREDSAGLNRAYLKSYQVVLLLMAPIALGMLATAPEIVYGVLGAKWTPLIPLLQIYSIMVLTRPISTNTAPLFMALGRPDYNTRAGLLLLAVMVPLALALLQWGGNGVAIAVVTAHIVGALYNIYQVNTLLPGTGIETMRLSIPALGSSLGMMVVVLGAKPLLAQMMDGPHTLSSLCILVILGGITYAILSYLTQRHLVRELWLMLAGILFPKHRQAFNYG